MTELDEEFELTFGPYADLKESVTQNPGYGYHGTQYDSAHSNPIKKADKAYAMMHARIVKLHGTAHMKQAQEFLDSRYGRFLGDMGNPNDVQVKNMYKEYHNAMNNHRQNARNSAVQSPKKKNLKEARKSAHSDTEGGGDPQHIIMDLRKARMNRLQGHPVKWANGKVSEMHPGWLDRALKIHDELKKPGHPRHIVSNYIKGLGQSEEDFHAHVEAGMEYLRDHKKGIREDVSPVIVKKMKPAKRQPDDPATAAERSLTYTALGRSLSNIYERNNLERQQADQAKEYRQQTPGQEEEYDEADFSCDLPWEALKEASRPYVMPDSDMAHVIDASGQTRAQFSRRMHGKDFYDKAREHLRKNIDDYSKYK